MLGRRNSAKKGLQAAAAPAATSVSWESRAALHEAGSLQQGSAEEPTDEEEPTGPKEEPNKEWTTGKTIAFFAVYFLATWLAAFTISALMIAALLRVSQN